MAKQSHDDDDDDDQAPKSGGKSKKLLIIGAAGLVLALALAVALGMVLGKKNASTEDEEDSAVSAPASGPPTYLPLDNMVVNLADPGGDRVAQVGIILQLSSNTEIDRVKAFLPSVRSEVLMLISQRTVEDLLSKEGKQKLSDDILEVTERHFGRPMSSKKDKDKPKERERERAREKEKEKDGPSNPVRGVLFSSFIVQ